MASHESDREFASKEILYVLFKRKWLILATFLAITLGTVVSVIRAPREYEAVAVLMIKRDRGELIVTPGQVPGTIASNVRLAVQQDQQAETELIRKRSLLERVVQTVGAEAVLRSRLAEPAKASAGGDVSPVAVRAAAFAPVVDAVQRIVDVPMDLLRQLNLKEPMRRTDMAVLNLSKRINVTPIQDSNLIKLAFSAPDARLAATVLDLVVKNYLDEYARLRATPGAVEFFERQVQRLAGELRAAEEALQQFEAREGLTVPGRQIEGYLKAAIERESALQLVRSEIDELRAKRELLRRELQALPERTRTIQEVRPSPLLETIRAKLLELEMEREKLLRKFTERDRRVQDVEREIAALKDRMLAEPAWEFGRETYSENGTRQPLAAELVATEAQLTRDEVKARYLERDMDDFYERVRHVDQSSYERARRQRKLTMLQEAYLLHVKKYDEVRISTAMDQSRILNVAVAEPVYVSPKPGVGGRSAGVLALMGTVVGLVAGVGGAFLREHFTHTFTTEASVRRHLGLPVLTSIPERR